VAFSLLFLFLNICSCKKFIQIDAPNTLLVTASVFNNDGAAHAALTSIYSNLSEDSYLVSLYTGLSGDELINLSSPYAPLYYNALLSTSSINVWYRWYNDIYQANAVIEGLSDFKGVSSSISKQLIGESKFLRAFCHFYLVNLYGDVPLVTTTNYVVNSQLPRSPKDEIYRQIISDLISAQELLNTNYIDQTDTTVTTQRARPTKAGATALLARVYLYTKKYDSAEQLATSVINDSRFSLVQNLSNVFLADSPESIWQLAIPQPAGSSQTTDGANYILLSAPQSINAQISNWFLDSFEPGDLRKATWVNSYTSGSNTWYFPFKYQVGNSGYNPNNRSEAVMVLRLAEQYLIRAEARAQQNKLSEATADLNVIRNRAGLPNVTDSIASSQPALLAAILHERQVELFTEWGHRWFDLKRTNTINSVMGAPGNICSQKGGVWNDDGHQALFPIPMTEINLDHNLTQNPGY